MLHIVRDVWINASSSYPSWLNLLLGKGMPTCQVAVFYSYIKSATNWLAGILDLENNRWERSKEQEWQGLETKSVPLHFKECFIVPGHKSPECPGLLLGPCSSPLLSCGCGMLSHAHTTQVNQSPFHRDMCNGMTFFILWVVSYSFQPACGWMRSPPPRPSTHTFYSVSGQPSLFTQGQKKSLRKVKGSLGPLSWLSMALSCHFLSSIIVLPRNSSMSLEFQLFFFLR